MVIETLLAKALNNNWEHHNSHCYAKMREQEHMRWLVMVLYCPNPSQTGYIP